MENTSQVNYACKITKATITGIIGNREATADGSVTDNNNGYVQDDGKFTFH